MMASMAPLAPMAGAQLFLLVALPDLTRLRMTCIRGLSKFLLFRLQNVVLPFLGLSYGVGKLQLVTVRPLIAWSFGLCGSGHFPIVSAFFCYWVKTE